MRIIMAIDIMGGKCVRLTRGDFNSQKIYNDDPLVVAQEIEASGIRYLHLVDLDGAKARRVVNLAILEKIAGRTNLKIDFGGGIRKTEDLRNLFNAGAAQVTAGSIAVTDKTLFLTWLSEFGADKMILGADSFSGKVSSGGWTETSGSDIISFIADYSTSGVKYAVCTDIEKDGMLQGPSVELYRTILETTDINLIASGGVTTMKDIEDLRHAGCEGAIIGKAVYEGKLKLKELGELC
jgi:phosphoribosylformimino-5-aminoimidazole carboxamide ribotide isomerase